MAEMNKDFFISGFKQGLIRGLILGLILGICLMFISYELSKPKEKEQKFTILCQNQLSPYWLEHHCSVCIDNECDAFEPDPREESLPELTIETTNESNFTGANFGMGKIGLCSWRKIPPEFVNVCYNVSIVEKISETPLNES